MKLTACWEKDQTVKSVCPPFRVSIVSALPRPLFYIHPTLAFILYPPYPRPYFISTLPQPLFYIHSTPALILYPPYPSPYFISTLPQPLFYIHPRASIKYIFCPPTEFPVVYNTPTLNQGNLLVFCLLLGCVC